MDTTLTCDLAITIAGRDIVLIRRGKAPFQGMLCLPGGHVGEGEAPKEAAVREAAEEIGLCVNHSDLHYLMDLEGLGHDPRPGHDRSMVFILELLSIEELAGIKAGSDAAAIEVRSLSELSAHELGFDHAKVIVKLLERRTS